MTYTIKSARYATSDKFVVRMMTVEFGAVMVNEKDRPELWKQLMDSGITIEPMAVPEKVQDPSAPVIIDGSNS